MAGEILVSGYVKVEKGGIVFERRLAQTSHDMSGDDMASGSQVIGTTAEAISFNTTDITSFGTCYFYNADATNFIDIGRDDTGTFRGVIRIPAGRWAIVPGLTASITLHAKADTANCRLHWFISEE